MHKKNKGKNKPKNPNPTPPQQQLVPEKEPEQRKEEERVPEIGPEVVIPNVNEETTVSLAGQIPAKPKRHRAGKKRKQNEAIVKIEETGEQFESKHISEETIRRDSNDKPAETTKCVDEATKLSPNHPEGNDAAVSPTLGVAIEPVIMPAARKKKNQINVCEKIAELDKEKQGNLEKSSIFVDSLETSVVEEKECSENEATPGEFDKKGTKKKNKKNKQNTTETTSKQKNANISSLNEPLKQEDVMSKSELKDDIKIKKPIKQDNIITAVESKDTKHVETIVERYPESSRNKNKNKKEKKSQKEEQNTTETIGIITEESTPEQIIDDVSKDDVNKSLKHKLSKINQEDKNHEMLTAETSTKSDFSTDKIPNPKTPDIQDEPNIDVGTSLNKDFKTKSCETNKSKKNKKEPITSDHLLDATSENISKKSGEDIKTIIKRQLANVEIAVLQSISGMAIETTETEKIKPAVEVKGCQSTTDVPILESNLEGNVESSFVKSCEDLSLSDKKSKFETNLKYIDNSSVKTSKIETLKKEEFVIKLFDKSLLPEPPAVIKSIKTEATDLKGKVMEVNKDMEDLKLSIEKSLAELTMIEEDDMPELVSITECTTPAESKEQEAIPVVNVESQILPLQQENPSLQSAPIENVHIMDVNVSNKNNQNETTAQTELEVEKSNEKTLEQHHKKHKGKGKSSTKCEDPTIFANVVIQDDQSPIDRTPSTMNPLPLSVTSSINPIKPEAKDCIKENQLCAQEPKGKGKGKNKKKEKIEQSSPLTLSAPVTTTQQTVKETTKSESTDAIQEEKKESKQEQQPTSAKDTTVASHKEHNDNADESMENKTEEDKNPSDSMDNFEDAMTSSSENLSQDIEIIAKENTKPITQSTSFVIPIDNEDMIFKSEGEPTEFKPPEEKKPTENPLSTRSKNLLGHPDIPVTSSKTDYKKEKNKNIRTPNTKQAKVKVKDLGEVDNNENKNKISKQSQTENKIVTKRSSKSSSPESDNEEEYVYKYSFRKVFLTNTCHVCKTELKGRRMACGYCNLIFYCSQKHKDEDWTQHQALCFAVSTIAHLKGLKFIYADASGVSGQEYRLTRMQVIVSCEKILKRKLLPCEQEALLYPRICSDTSCREWRSGNLTDCDGCGLVSYCSEKPQHLSREHQAWCKSYRLYYKLVTHQQSKGRLEPRLPSKIVGIGFQIPNKINELLAQVYEEKIDMDDIHYAALTQLATAPLTAAYAYQLHIKSSNDSITGITNGHQNKSFTLHIVGAELQFEADTLNKWEVFFLHLLPDVQELRVVFVGPELNPSKLPLELLAKIKMCRQCRQDKRKIQFDYQDGQLYHIYAENKGFTKPDIVCAFNPGLHRTTSFGGVDSWPDTINCILKQKTPFCVTSYTKYELPRDLLRIRECSNHRYKIVLEPTLNPYASIRPDRNFISDDEMPLIFKNYYLMVLSGTS